MLEMEQELEELRRNSTQSSPPIQTQSLSVSDVVSISNPITNETPSNPTDGTLLLSQTAPYDPCLSSKAIGNFQLSAAQVTELFSIFSHRCHPHLPMKMCLSPETVHGRCPLLFWAICTATMVGQAKPSLEEEISKLVAAAIALPPRSVEVIQGLLVLCMWPLPFYTTKQDPALLYSGIAVQASLQMGLHRPGFTRDFVDSYKKSVMGESEDVKSSTWLACYIISQQQASRLGVPLSVPEDFSFEVAATSKDISPVLVNLYRISRFTTRFNTALGGSPTHPSGLLEPSSRLNILKLFVSEFDRLQIEVDAQGYRVLELALLGSLLHLLSYAIREDTPQSEGLIPIYHRAQITAMSLIQASSEMSLSTAPHQIVRLLSFATFTLIKISWSPYVSESELLQDKVHLAMQTLSMAIKTPDDHTERIINSIRECLMLEDNKRTPPVNSRMAASIIYDCIRIRRECFLGIRNETNWSDLDGLDWQDLCGGQV